MTDGVRGLPYGQVTRGELDQVRAELRSEIRDLEDRLTQIDNHGTRGEALLRERLGEAREDIAELRRRRDADEKEREADRRAITAERVTRRRWLIGMGFSAATIAVTVLGVLAAFLQLHGKG